MTRTDSKPSFRLGVWVLGVPEDDVTLSNYQFFIYFSKRSMEGWYSLSGLGFLGPGLGPHTKCSGRSLEWSGGVGDDRVTVKVT